MITGLQGDPAVLNGLNMSHNSGMVGETAIKTKLFRRKMSGRAHSTYSASAYSSRHDRLQKCARIRKPPGGRRRTRLAKKALVEIWNAEDKTHALAAVRAFGELFGAKSVKAVKISGDLEELLAFYDYCAEHWVHLRSIAGGRSTRAAPRRPRPRRRGVRQRQTRRTRRRSTNGHAVRRDRGMTKIDP